MKNIKKLIVISLMVIGTFNSQVCARVRGVMSVREFEQDVAHKGICVALFYSVTDKRNAPLRQDNKQLQRMFDELSIKDTYDDAGLVFIKINLARNDLNSLADRYGIVNVPQFVLFHDGQRVVNEEGKPCELNGFVTHKELESFIDKHCGTEVRRLDMAKAEVQKQRIDEEKKPWLPYFYPRDIFVRDYDPAQRDME
jgi:hypothetical protein